MSKNNIMLVTNEVANENTNEVAIKNETQIVSELLKEKDIIKNMEEGLPNENINNNINNNTNNKTKGGIIFDYDDSNSDENNYQSEDENLITLTTNSVNHNMNMNLMNSVNTINSFKKLDYKDVEYRIERAYFDINHKYSSALDILASYLKGQKVIYMESKFFCETHLNMYMMPAILLSSAATVLTSFVTTYKWGALFIASLNAIIACLLAIVNYLKLDAASEAHKISSHQYDKLQSTVEFTSGSVLLFRYNDLQRLEYE